MNKIEQAKKLYGKIQGMLWNRERNEEYGHYDAAKECRKIIEQTRKQIEDLGLTLDEQIDASNGADMNEAKYWDGRY